MTQTGAHPGIKGQMEPGWKALLREQLRHTVTLVRAAPADRYGETTEGERVRVPCFIDGSRSRVKNTDGEEVQVSWSVDLSPAVEAQINDRLEDGRDRAGRILLPAGRIASINDTTHPSEGRLAHTAQVVRA